MNALTDTSIMHTLCILITLVDRVYYLYFLEIYFLLLDLGYFNIYFGSTLQTSKCNVFWHYFCGGMTFRLPLTNFSKSHEQFNLSNYILIRNIHQYKIFLELIMSALFTISLCWTNLLYLISMLIEIMRAILLIMEYKYI